MDLGRGAGSVFTAEITATGRKLLKNSCSRPQPGAKFLFGVVVDQIELDVFIAPAFTGLSVCAPKQV